ncbi:hypothetical protein EBT25_13745 [bacterium]|jgi:DNA-binding transcriptional regulator YiaG|nr:hypothetical protein [bacterium]
MSTTTYVFPCASTQGLTLAQKREAVKALRASISEELAVRKMLRADAKVAKAAAKAAKAAARAQKKADRIAKMEAKLAALKSTPVGAKAIKANRKPSKVKTTKFATVVTELSTATA